MSGSGVRSPDRIEQLISVYRERAQEALRRSVDPAVSRDERYVQIGLAGAWTSAANELEAWQPQLYGCPREEKP